MLVPARTVLQCIVGADFVETFQFWADAKQSIPFQFAGWASFRFAVGPLTLTDVGGGIAVNAAAGTLTPSIPRALTAAQTVGVSAYSLSAVDGGGKLGFLMAGEFDWLDAQ